MIPMAEIFTSSEVPAGISSKSFGTTASACPSMPRDWRKGRFIWPSPADGVVGVSASQLAYMLDGIDWRNPRHSWRPSQRWIRSRISIFLRVSGLGFVIQFLVMDADLGALPDDIDALKAVLTAEHARMREVVAERDVGAAELAVARAKASEDLALIAYQKLRIAKLERQIYGPRSERSAPAHRSVGAAARGAGSERHRG